MRTHRAKSGCLPAEYIPPTFSTRYPLPLFRRLTVGAAIEKNFFDFYFSDFACNLSGLCIENNFLFFFRDFVPIQIRTRFYQNICRFNSHTSFARYSSSVSFYIHHVWISRFQTLNFDSFLLVEFLLASISTCFSIVDSTLLLVINKHLCLCKFVLCLFKLF